MKAADAARELRPSSLLVVDHDGSASDAVVQMSPSSADDVSGDVL